MLLQIIFCFLYGWIIFHCIYVPHLYPFICWWTFKLLPQFSLIRLMFEKWSLLSIFTGFKLSYLRMSAHDFGSLLVMMRGKPRAWPWSRLSALTWSSYPINTLWKHPPLGIFFLMWTILKSLLNLLQYCFCFMFWFFGHEACGISAPQPGIEPTPPTLQGKVFTTGPPGKSPPLDILLSSVQYSVTCSQNLPTNAIILSSY